MTYSKPLIERERALEEAFFRKESERLLEAMRERRTRAARFDALSKVLGLRDPAIIDPLLDLGLREENVTALMMAPLVAVAWADRTLDNEERRYLLDAESELGIEADSPAGEQLAVWLDHRPHPELLDTWAAYVTELCRVMPEDDRERLRQDIVGWTRRIANALEKTFLRGGVPTRAERQVIDRVEAAFGARPQPNIARRVGPKSDLDDFVNSLT